jgi:two-component system response regulator HydG
MLNDKKANVLIVDDDESICRTISLVLENEGYGTDTANSGTEALKKLDKAYFNAALLDIRLPDVEGTELLKTFRTNSPLTVKIMLTGYPKLENAVEALNQGADAYLIKPVHPEQLIKVLNEKLRQQEEAEKTTEESISVFLEARTRRLLQGSK